MNYVLQPIASVENSVRVTRTEPGKAWRKQVVLTLLGRGALLNRFFFLQFSLIHLKALSETGPIRGYWRSGEREPVHQLTDVSLPV